MASGSKKRSFDVDLDLLFHSSKDKKHDTKQRSESDLQVVTCLRCLAMDAVQTANSGHPGTPMAMAPVAYALWARVLQYDPVDPTWPNRDRFVLSMGHASMLLYGLLHIAGVRDVDSYTGQVLESMSVPMEAIKTFRKLDSRCPGHPEYRWTAGVEMTTGPLGQGVATSVGMAIASKWKAAHFNKPEFELFNFDVFAMCGDGCLQEGVSHEAASLAGHLRLDNLCWIWDNNQITIDGNTAWAISEDVATRFIAYGWNVLRVGDANDVDGLERAIRVFKREKQRPTFLIVDSHIAWGAPTKQDTFHAHGSPLGAAEIAATKRIYGWPEDSKFLVPPEVPTYFQKQLDSRGGAARRDWDTAFKKYRALYPAEGAIIEGMKSGKLPEDWDRFCKEFPADPKGLATRQSSSQVLNMAAQGVPWLVGGSADLRNSCLTGLKFDGVEEFMAPLSGWGTYRGRNFNFGIREHAMGSICNGLALSGLRPFCSTFLVFSDYMKPPIRMASLMEIPCIWIFTHDSIGVGEDGPTHQPIEHLAALRSTPGLLTFRPCDANEVLEMWKVLMALKHEPAAVVLSRQALPTLDRSIFAPASGLTKGAYILIDTKEPLELILMATGSEVSLMVQAYDKLKAEGCAVRLVSIPCVELFKQQSAEYQESVLPNSCRARVSIEAATKDSWGSFIGLDGEHIGMITFGASAPISTLHKELGFTVEEVVAAAKRVMAKNPRSVDSEASVARQWKRKRSASLLDLSQAS